MNRYRLTIVDDAGRTVVSTEVDSEKLLVATDATGVAVPLQDGCMLTITRIEPDRLKGD